MGRPKHLEKGWYEIAVRIVPGQGRARRLRADLGRGLCAYHSVGLWPQPGGAAAIVHLHRPAKRLELEFSCGQTSAAEDLEDHLTICRLGVFLLGWRRAKEIFSSLAGVFRFSRSSRCPRYLRFRGTFAFPVSGRSQSRYHDWIALHELPAADCGSSREDISFHLVFRSGERQEASDDAFGPTSDVARDAAWLIIIRDDVALHEQALASIRAGIEAWPDAALFYGGHDVRNEQGHRRHPVVQRGFSPERLKREDFLGPVVVVRREVWRELQAQQRLAVIELDHATLLQVMELAGAARFHALPNILAHYDSPRAPVADRPSAPRLQFAQSRSGSPLITVIMPTKDKLELLSLAVSSVLEQSSWKHLELIIVDHESKKAATKAYLEDVIRKDRRVRVSSHEGPFNFSDMCNRAATLARGDILAFVNNDVYAVTPAWMEAMAEFALQPDTGCVGALLTYPDERVQHAGVVLGMGGIAGHLGRGLAQRNPALAPLLRSARNVAAVSAACAMIARTLFRDLGGFDGVNLPVAFNDVDLCLRCLEIGRQNIWTPEAVLVHHESATREADDAGSLAGRFGREFHYMRSRWGHLLDADPFHSPLLSLSEPGLDLRL